MNVLQMSVQAGLMVIIAGLLRVLALDKAPKRAFLVLWGLVIARMLLPFSVPSKWSVLNLARGKRETAIASGMAGIPFLPLPEAAAGEPPAVSVPPLRAVWLFGMFLLSAVFVWMIVRSYRKFRFAVPFEHEAVSDWMSAHRLRRPFLILRSDQVEIPLAIGLIRPRMIFPASMKLDQPEKIRFILAHEFFHIRRLDMLWKLLALAAVCVHWFNPLSAGRSCPQKGYFFPLIVFLQFFLYFQLFSPRTRKSGVEAQFVFSCRSHTRSQTRLSV